MKKETKLNRFLLVLCLLAFAKLSLAQVEATMPFMSSMPEITYYNPAFKPKYKFSFALPSVFVQYANNGFAYNDTGQRENNYWKADVNKLSGALKKKNYLNLNAQVDAFRLGLKVNPRLYLTINASVKSYNRFFFPGDLLTLLADGNAAHLDKALTISPKVEALQYLDIGVGAGYSINKKLDVGLRFKVLRGILNVSTKSGSVDILTTTSEISASADIELLTSGVKDIDGDNLRKNFGKNSGFAVDIGATYKVTDKLTVGASIIDLGSITWKNNTHRYGLNPDSAKITFKGVDLQKILDDEKLFEGLENDIDNNFDFEDTPTGSYKTALPMKVYLTGSYMLGAGLSINALYFMENYKGRLMAGFSTSLHKEFGRRLGLSLSYTITNRSFNNLGLGVALNLAPIQLFFVSDDLLRAAFSSLGGDVNKYVNSTKIITVRAGMNIVLKWDKTPEKNHEADR